MFDRHIHVSHEHNIRRHGVYETANFFIAVELSNTLWWFMLESAFGGRDTAHHLVRMRRIIIDDLFQALSIGGPANHQNSLPELSGNRFLSQIVKKQLAPSIKPGHCRDRC